MYRKNFKQRKIVHLNNPDNTTTVADSSSSSNLTEFRSIMTNQNPFVVADENQKTSNTSLDHHLNQKLLKNNSLLTSFSRKLKTTTTRKRKYLFEDIDLSDLKTDTKFPSFIDARKSLTNTTLPSLSQKPTISMNQEVDPLVLDPNMIHNDKNQIHQSTNDLLSLDDIDFEEDLFPIQDSKTNDQPHCLTDADKSAMIELVKNKLNDEKVNYSSSKNNVEEPSISLLLKDDEDFDLDDLDDEDLLDLEPEMIKILDQYKNSNNRKESWYKNDIEFCTALGSRCSRPKDSSYERVKKMFVDIELLLVKEMACYLWNQQQ